MSKITLQAALSTLVGYPTDVTMTIDHSVFIERSWLRVLGLKKVSPDHKETPRPQKGPKSVKKRQK